MLNPLNQKEENKHGGNVKSLTRKIRIWEKDKNSRAATVTFHRDGSVRLGGYSDGSGYFPSPDEYPGHKALFEYFNIPIVQEARAVTALDWKYQEWDALVNKYKPNADQEIEFLKWLYSLGWNRIEFDSPLGTLYVPVKCFQPKMEDIGFAKIEIYEKTSLEQWQSYKNPIVLCKSQRNFGAAYLEGDGLSQKFKKEVVWKDISGMSHNSTWELVGYGKNPQECDDVHANLLRIDKISGTGAILILSPTSIINCAGRT